MGPALAPAFAAFADRLVDLLRPPPGGSCLDVACGDGMLAAALARAVGPRGRVLAIDTDEAALTGCRRRAAALGRGAVDTRVAVPSLGGDAAAFDVAGSLFTLAHRRDAASLLGDAWRALAPGGRLAVAVWAEPASVPPLRHLAAAFATVTGGVPPTLTEATSLGTGTSLGALAGAAGLRDARIGRLRDVLRFDGAGGLLTTLSAAYALEDAVAALDDTAVATMVDVLSLAMRPHTRADGTIVVPVDAALLEAVAGPATR